MIDVQQETIFGFDPDYDILADIDEFRAASNSLFREYQSRLLDWKYKWPRRDSLNPGDWLKLEVYKFAPSVDASEWGRNVRDIYEEESKKYVRGPKPSNCFQRLLGTVFGGNCDLMPANKRERIGKSLQYAFNHYVKADDLLNFLKAVTVADAIEGLAKAHVKAEFDSRIKKKCVNDELWPLRGPYPADIMSFAERKRSKLLWW